MFTSASGNEKGDGANLCEAPSGPFRQISPVPFFVAKHIQYDTSMCMPRVDLPDVNGKLVATLSQLLLSGERQTEASP
jgi:hypothetical protein